MGTGLGTSIGARGYLPEPHTDFIIAVIGEEFGIIGILVLVFCYIWLVSRAISIGRQARYLELFFSSFVAQGIGICLALQCCINIGVNLNLLPATGLTLPLMSYGGSSIFITLMCITLLLRIDYENRRAKLGYPIQG